MIPERLIANPLLEIRLKGTQAQMGAQYGEILVAEGGYEALLDFYPRMAESLIVSGMPRRLRNGPVRRVAGQLVNWAVDSMVKSRLPQYEERAHAMARAAQALARDDAPYARDGCLSEQHRRSGPFGAPSTSSGQAFQFRGKAARACARCLYVGGRVRPAFGRRRTDACAQL
jgi:hypothetical protein